MKRADPARPDAPTDGWYPHFVLGLLLLAYVFSFIDRNILALLVGPMRRDLGISDFQMSLLQGPAFALFYSTMAFPIAHWADRARRTGIVAIGIAVWSAMTAGCGTVRSFPALFTLRLGVGLGEAALSPPTASLLSDYYSAERYPRAMAIFSLGISLGTGLSFLVGGLVVEAASGMEALSLPLVGALRPWQVTFIVIGLPGLLLAGFVAAIREPARRGSQRGRDGQIEVIPLADVARFLGERWRLYLSFPVATAFLGAFGYGMSAWYPSFLIRTFDLSIGEAGTLFGLVYVIVGPIGTLLGVRLAEGLQARGHRDAHIRFILYGAVGMAFFGTVGPLMPGVLPALAMLIPSVFLKSAYLGSSSSAMQLVTPNQIRAKVTALQIFFGTIIGMTVGASGIAFLTDFVFQDDQAVRYSLALTSAVTCTLAAGVLWSCLKPYTRAAEEARERALREERALTEQG